jgi:hypothetical protein
MDGHVLLPEQTKPMRRDAHLDELKESKVEFVDLEEGTDHFELAVEEERKERRST